MSTPLTAGTVLLLREYLIKQEEIANPSAALVKTALIHGATDVFPGQYGNGLYLEIPSAPNSVAGWGRVNLEGAVNGDPNYSLVYKDISSPAPEDSSYARTFSMDVADDGKPFKATLGWIDYPGSEATAGALVNDLDLRVQKPDGTWVYPDNANKGGVLSFVNFLDGMPDTKNDDEKVAIRVTPSSYPMQVESVMVNFANPDFDGSGTEEETGLSLVIYEWTGTGVGEELYRKKYEFVRKGTPLFPVDYAVTEGEIVIAVEVESDNVGVMVEDGNPSGRSLVWENDDWATASFSAGITAFLRAAPSETHFDRVNNTVSVTVPDPDPGTYTVEVSAYNIPYGPQPYALVMSGLTTAIPTSGNTSVGTNPGQPDAPTVTISERTRTSKSKNEIENETGVMLDEVFGGLVEFKGTITGNYGAGMVSMRYAVTGLPARKAGTFSLKKLLGSGLVRDFTYPKIAEYADGNWWLADAGGEYIDADRVLDPDGTYYVVSVIKDNGPFDVNPDVNIVEDPQVLSGFVGPGRPGRRMHGRGDRRRRDPAVARCGPVPDRPARPQAKPLIIETRRHAAPGTRLVSGAVSLCGVRSGRLAVRSGLLQLTVRFHCRSGIRPVRVASSALRGPVPDQGLVNILQFQGVLPDALDLRPLPRTRFGRPACPWRSIPCTTPAPGRRPWQRESRFCRARRPRPRPPPAWPAAARPHAAPPGPRRKRFPCARAGPWRRFRP